MVGSNENAFGVGRVDKDCRIYRREPRKPYYLLQKQKTGTSQQSRSEVKLKKCLLDRHRQVDAVWYQGEELPAVILAQGVAVEVHNPRGQCHDIRSHSRQW